MEQKCAFLRLQCVSVSYVVFAGVRKPTDVAALQRESPNLRPIVLDVTRPEQIRAALQTVSAFLDDQKLPLVGVVNNGGHFLGLPVECVPTSALRAMFECHVFGAHAMARAFLPLLRRSRGRLINVTSMNGRFVSGSVFPYTPAKHALEAMSDELRIELRPLGVSVSTVAPGPVDTRKIGRASCRERG